MKAKYMRYGNDCIIYNQVICEDNLVVVVESYECSWTDAEPKTITKICLTNAEARRAFFQFCDKFQEKCDRCLYQEI